MPFGNYNTSKWGSQKATTNQLVPYDTNRIQRQLNNARLRIQDSGFTPNEDNRNWFEKATNLPKNQNAFLDVLDLLNRPSQAILNTFNANDENITPLEAAWRGFSGKERTRGADIAKKMGIDNKVGQFTVGTGLEILADPLNLIPGGTFIKGAKKATEGLKTGYKAAENVLPVLGKLRSTVEPIANGAKDALGSMFKYQYNWDKTLNGASDGTLKKLFNTTQNDIRYQSENALQNIADTAKTTGLEKGTDIGRLMEKDLKQVDELGNSIPRPTREISSDPKIQQAATSLMKSNDMIRNMALENGININELEGYMTHVLSAEERKARKLNKPVATDRGNFGTGQPNKKILNQRKLTGSVEDVNDQLGRKLFEPNAYFATAQGQKRLIEYINSVKFRREILSNPSFATKFEKGIDIPNNAVVIDTNNYKFIKDSGDILGNTGLADEIGGKYVVTKGVKEALDRYQRLNTDEGIKSFLKAFDTAQTWWKKGALFSIPYHLRNDIGAKFNNFIAGMSPADLTKFSKEATEDIYRSMIKGEESKLFNEYRKQGLSSSNLSQVEFARYGEGPEKAIERTITKASQNDGTLAGRLKTEVKQLKNPLNIFDTSRDFGDFIDQTNRFALYKWAREKKGLSSEQAAELVRSVQFDYTRTTNFEKNIATRIVPFYRWMRNNIPFQLREFANDPRRYAALNKIRLNAQSSAGINDENVPQWMKDSFAIPVYGDKGKGKFLSMNLPLSDLTRTAEPLKMLIDSLSPLIKTPIELSTNRNFFFNKPIEEYQGQQKMFQIPGTDIQFGIPIKTAYGLEQATGQIGRGFSQYLQRPEQENQDIKFRMPSMGISSVVKDYDAERAKFFELLNTLKMLQDQMDYIEQQTGQRPRGVNEIR